MNELVLNADGTVTVMGDGGTVQTYLYERVQEETIPAVTDNDGNIITPAVVPDVATLAQEVTPDQMKVHAWRLPFMRVKVMSDLRRDRDLRMDKNDKEITQGERGRPARPGRNRAQMLAIQQGLRDMPVAAQAALDAMTNTDDMEAYVPPELE